MRPALCESGLHNFCRQATIRDRTNGMSMGPLRLRICGGLAIFILPLCATFVLSAVRPLPGNMSDLHEIFPGALFGSRVFEQTITGQPGNLRNASLFLGTFRRHNTGTLAVDLVDTARNVLARAQKPANALRDNAWAKFNLGGVPLHPGRIYALRLRSPDSTEGNAVTWWASRASRYPGGRAMVDGQPFGGDFALRLEFESLSPDGRKAQP